MHPEKTIERQNKHGHRRAMIAAFVLFILVFVFLFAPLTKTTAINRPIIVMSCPVTGCPPIPTFVLNVYASPSFALFKFGLVYAPSCGNTYHFSTNGIVNFWPCENETA